MLALLVLPTIIIASRAALKAVPPSIKEAALGVGASHQQAMFHHMLPLAMPGIMTGTIIGMAHALGETAPLLMIGMVAFIVEVPSGFTDAATVLPVQIYPVVRPAGDRLSVQDRGRNHGPAGVPVRHERTAICAAQAVRASVVIFRGEVDEYAMVQLASCGGGGAGRQRRPPRWSRAASTSTTAKSMR